MDERYKSLAALKPDAWIKHFRRTVGKPESWNERNKLVIIERSKDDSKNPSASDIPLNSVSPVEQYTNMAQAEMTQKASDYNLSSLSSRPSQRVHRKRKRREGSRSDSKRKSQKSKKRKKKKKSHG